MHGLSVVSHRALRVRRSEEQARGWLQPEEEIAAA